MEVSLLDAAGIPEGCLLSVRAGTTRRQAPANSDNLRLNFPRKFGDEAVKVDLLAAVGSISFQASEGVDSYPIEVPVAGSSLPAKLTLQLRSLDSTAAGSELENALGGQAGGNKPRRHKAALEARSYLDQHNLLGWVQELVEGFIEDRPNDPWAYVDQRTKLARKVNDVPDQTEVRPVLPAGDKQSIIEDESLQQPEAQEQDEGVAAEEKTEINSAFLPSTGTWAQARLAPLRRKEATAVPAKVSAAAEALQAEPQAAAPAPVAAASAEVVEALAEVLQEASSKLEEKEPLQAASVAEEPAKEMPAASATPPLSRPWFLLPSVATWTQVLVDDASVESTQPAEPPVAAIDSDLLVLKTQAMRGLVQAAADGSLLATLSAMPPLQSPEAAAEENSSVVPPPAGQEDEGAVAPPEAQRNELKSIKTQLAQCLRIAAENGMLAEALKDIQFPTAKGAVTEVAPQAAIELPVKLPIQELKERVAAALASQPEVVKASSPTSTSADKVTRSDIRRRTREVLMNACSNGTLDAAMAKISQQSPKADMAQQPAEAVAAAETESAPNGLGELRERAQALLIGSAADGRLAAALASLESTAAPAPSPGPDSQVEAPAQDATRFSHRHSMEDDRSTVQDSVATEDAVTNTVESLFAEALNYHEETATREVEDVRLKTSAVLMQAAEDGSLVDAMDAIIKRRAGGDEKGAVAGNGEVEEIRLKASNVLMEAAEDGSLMDAMEKIFKWRSGTEDAGPDKAGRAPSKGTEDMRLKTSDVLMRAAEDGSLLEAMEEIARRRDASMAPPQADAPSAMQQDIGALQPTRPKEPKPADTRPLAALDGMSVQDLEARIRKRNERFRRENEALRRENRRLKDAWETGEAAARQAEANAKLREDLTKLSEKVGRA
mmetsp:Transcript_20245/g.47263  ORF Transcript_20245/g.47263 Transcript_20245/m.47263 type:complete len:895 (-) Transcript_20245:96-2780(-)